MRFIDKIRYRRMNRDERLEFLRKKGVRCV